MLLETFIVVYLLMVFFLFKQKGKNLVINDVFWLVLAWVFLFGIYFTSGIIYKYPLSNSTLLYVITIIVIYISFRYIGKSIKFSKRSDNRGKVDIASEEYFDTKPYFYISFIGFIIYIFDMFRLNSISFGVKSSISSSMIGSIAFLFVPLSMIIWLYEIMYAIKYNRKPKPRAFFSALIFCTVPILYSGRQTLLIFFLATFIAITFSIKEIKLRKKIKNLFFKNKAINLIRPLSIAGVVVALIYLVDLSGSRYGNDMVAMFEYVSGANITDEALEFAQKFGPFSNLVLNIMFYYSHQLSKLEIVFQNYTGPYMLGMYQLNYISRRLPSFLELDYRLVADSVRSIMSYYGIPSFSSGWQTAVGVIIYDFGKLGGLIFTAIIGLIVGRKRRKFLNCNSIMETIFQVMICVAMVLSIQTSALFDVTWAYALYWLLILSFIQKRKIKFTL